MNYRLFLFLFTVIPLTGTLGQSTSLTSFIECVELQNGPDNLLINGRPYAPGNSNADGHPYFQTEDWQPGMVYVNATPFPASHLKYNLATQQLVIRHDRPNGTNQTVVASALLVDSFRIEEHLFVKQGLVLPQASGSSYLEKIFEEELSFFRQQKKLAVTPSNSKPYGGFRQLNDVFYLLMDGNRHKITRKKEFLACFPDHKSVIKKYMKDQSFKWKNMTDIQFTNLLKFCHDQI